MITLAVVVNEAFVLNSGQEGWLFVGRRDSEFSSQIIVHTWATLGPGNAIWKLSVGGFSDEVDADDLVGVVRTLCVQSVGN